MNIKIKRVIRALKRRLRNFIFMANIRLNKNIFVFGAPYHSNLGDQAQTYCIGQLLNYAYPNYKVRIFDTAYLTDNNYSVLNRIKKSIKKTDKIFLHSGYHMTDLYMLEENMHRKVLQLFSHHPIVILPQTINYIDPEQENIARLIYNEHQSLTIMCRDEVSYEKAKELFPNKKLLLFPDIVTTMIGKNKYTNNRSGILLCMRNDKESMYSKEKISALSARLSKIDKVDISDTTINLSATEITNNREKILKETWNEYSKYRVIITDRYHGTIFSMISSTPVLVISSTDHKLSSGVNWFGDSFDGYIKYVENIEKVVDEVKLIYSREFKYDLPPYFWDNYYKNLRQQIES